MPDDAVEAGRSAASGPPEGAPLSGPPFRVSSDAICVLGHDTRSTNPDGTFTPATRIRLVPSRSGVKPAYPEP